MLTSNTPSSDSDESDVCRSHYRVLARKYRPKTFDALIGQQGFVRTLTNAIRLSRIGHAYLFTGIRGVGKTTSARIMARAFNCIGPDGTGDITSAPCGACHSCLAIDESRHVDVIEIDAASHTGIADVRELIDSVAYYPVSARFKVYIIDEVHMLSEKAFNALLKTLEEPPPHVIFILATTEVRKVPVTILSRCQRFDLRRVETDQLSQYFDEICRYENIKADQSALSLIARAADGSVRDGLSLLDQAIILGTDGMTVELVHEMLGLKDRSRLLDVFITTLKGQVKKH